MQKYILKALREIENAQNAAALVINRQKLQRIYDALNSNPLPWITTTDLK